MCDAERERGEERRDDEAKGRTGDPDNRCSPNHIVRNSRGFRPSRLASSPLRLIASSSTPPSPVLLFIILITQRVTNPECMTVRVSNEHLAQTPRPVRRRPRDFDSLLYT